MLARIIDNKFIYLASLTVHEEDLVQEHFSVEIKNYQYIDPSQRGGWNGIYKRYDRGKQRLARPFLGELRLLCNKRNIPLVVQDERPVWSHQVTPPEQIDKNFLPGITLEDYQVAAIQKGCGIEVGIISAPMGSGKSELIAGFCKAINCPTIILADQLIIIDQLKERLELREVINDVGLFYAGKTPAGQSIIIGSIQSLVLPARIPSKPSRYDYKSDEGYGRALKKHEATLQGFRKRSARAKQFQELVKKAEMLIVDECDLASSNQFRYVFRHLFSGRRRYGFSGTPYDPAKPLQNLFVKEHLGSVVFEVDRREVERLGRIIPVEYFMFSFGEDGNIHESSAYDIAMTEKMIENPMFHKAVAAICSTYPDDGTLILVDRDNLGEALQAIIPGSVFIHGQTPQRRRNQVLDAFERRELKVLIGGKIIRRGLDLKGGCENLIIATGGKLWSTFNQQVGRAVRVNRRNRARVFDFYFLNNKYLYSHSKSRLRAMVGLGYKTRVIFRDGQQLNGEQFVNSRFRRPKRRSSQPSFF